MAWVTPAVAVTGPVVSRIEMNAAFEKLNKSVKGLVSAFDPVTSMLTIKVGDKEVVVPLTAVEFNRPDERNLVEVTAFGDSVESYRLDKLSQQGTVRFSLPNGLKVDTAYIMGVDGVAREVVRDEVTSRPFAAESRTITNDDFDLVKA